MANPLITQVLKCCLRKPESQFNSGFESYEVFHSLVAGTHTHNFRLTEGENRSDMFHNSELSDYIEGERDMNNQQQKNDE